MIFYIITSEDNFQGPANCAGARSRLSGNQRAGKIIQENQEKPPYNFPPYRVKYMLA
jgi:hypothetical protein